MSIEGGAIYWAQLDGAGHTVRGLRPVLIMTETPINTSLHGAVVVPLSTHAPRRYHMQVVINEKTSDILHEQIRFLPEEKIMGKYADAPRGLVSQVWEKLGGIICHM